MEILKTDTNGNRTEIKWKWNRTACPFVQTVNGNFLMPTIDAHVKLITSPICVFGLDPSRNRIFTMSSWP